MKLRILSTLLFSLAAAQADTFGSGLNTFTMDFVTIGDAGNAADGPGPGAYGSVGYTYRMGVNEVSEGMINTYNAFNPTLMLSTDARGSNLPATSISWNEAARFVNWLNESSGYSAAYKFAPLSLPTDDIELWLPGDAGYNSTNRFRNDNAHYYLPSEDEWYKAAYYDGAGGYWDYATGSDTAPGGTSGGISNGTAVYRDGVIPNPVGPADITNAGGLSFYGTMAQNGNAFEIIESASDGTNNVFNEDRVLRGGAWDDDATFLISTYSESLGTMFESATIGFRVAAVPEPSAFFLTLLGMISVVTRRRR